MRWEPVKPMGEGRTIVASFNLDLGPGCRWDRELSEEGGANRPTRECPRSEGTFRARAVCGGDGEGLVGKGSGGPS